MATGTPHGRSEEDALRQAQVAFIGRIVAASTHKFHNHLAVIKEYSGLIGDLLRSDQPDIRKVIDRCGDISGSIIERADQAAAMEEALNRFVHRGDVALSLFGAGKAAEELFLLYHICASRRRINFETQVAEGVPDIVNSPALFQFVLYTLTSEYLESLDEEGTIAVAVTPGRDGMVRVALTVTGEVDREPELDAESHGPLLLALEKLGARLSGPRPRGQAVEALLDIPSLQEE
ncbi:MAG: hypothetical protein C4534_05130 [Gaiellales bacterium]|nr:MAG: hypothetical protein C4534_05130 [Gaiellales bacterium]